MADVESPIPVTPSTTTNPPTEKESDFVLSGLGLLGGMATTPTQQPLQALDASKFVSNGLLGGGKSPTSPVTPCMQTTNGSERPLEDSLTTESFVSNGLLELGTKKTTPVFAPNGLLDGITELGSGTSGDSVFVANGLLGGTTDAGLDVQMGDTEFVPNNLLGAVLHAGTSTRDDDDNVGSSEGTTVPSGSSMFISNGLLGGMESTLVGSFSETQCTQRDSDSQDDLPSVSQLLQQYGLGDASSSGGTGAYAISATNYEGKTILLKKRRKVVKSAAILLENRKTSTLLEIPVHKLKEQLLVAYAESLTSESIPSTSASTAASTSSKPANADLWVDRYRPKRFTDLLGDERVHRETMAWLKEWDFCVFKKKKLQAKKQAQEKQDNGEYKYQDAYHRPWEKILLLSGPAGLGKTTLAHVAARHAGYDVLEINASDSRSGQVIEDRIQPALESGSAINAKRPVCVVIDEIDGATGAGDNAASFVHKLVALTFDKPGKKSRSNKKDAKSSRPLLRPIICICNDLYSSALTKLRQYARIIRFNRPADIYITKRLRHICEYEGMRADSRALTTLVGLAKGDMRSCLNTLQFIKSRSTEVTEPLVRTAAAGLKEGDASSSTALNNLFAPLPRRRVKELGLSEAAEARYVGRLSADLDASGTLDKVAVGCFEHYAKLRNYEATLDRHEKAADWLMHYDTFSGTMRSEREYALLPYLSYTIVPFYPLFHERGSEKVERPSADWEAHVRTKASEEIFKSLSRCIQSATGHQSVGLRHLLSNQTMQLEFIPYLNRIISPPLRPVHSQVTKPSERALLARLVEVMVSLELRFVQEKTEDGQMVYLLDPPIDAFVTYDGKRAPDIAVPRYAVRHLVAVEIDAQLIARQAEASEKSTAAKSSIFKNARQVADDLPEDGDESTNAQTDIGNLNSLLTPFSRSENRSVRKRKAEELDPADKPPVDFFGRPIIVPVKKQATSINRPVEKPYKVSFRFNEGNSAAVRKPVKVSSFL